jgi:hypothetical protein
MAPFIYPSTKAALECKGAHWALLCYRLFAMFSLLTLVISGIGIAQSNEPAWAHMTSNTAWVYFTYNSYWTLICTVIYFALASGLTFADRFVATPVVIDTHRDQLRPETYRPKSSTGGGIRYRLEILTWVLLETVSSAQLVICVAYWVAIICVRAGAIDVAYYTTFIQGTAHAAGLVFMVGEMMLGSRRWVMSHSVFVLCYVLLWIVAAFFLYVGTGMFTYVIQDPTYVPLVVACAFYPGFVCVYFVAYCLMFCVDRLIGRGCAPLVKCCNPALPKCEEIWLH